MTTPPPPKPSATYPALCHCGKVRFSVTLSPPLEVPAAAKHGGDDDDDEKIEPYKVLECSCSICTRAGYLLVYPNVRDVRFEEGAEEWIRRYKFHEGAVKDHLFCGHCGTSLMIDFHDVYKEGYVQKGKGKGISGIGEGWEIYGVSARTFKGLDLKKLTYRYLDGIGTVGEPGDTAGRWDEIIQERKKEEEEEKKGHA